MARSVGIRRAGDTAGLPPPPPCAHHVPLPASLPVLLRPIELGVLMQLLDSEDEILVGNAALCLGNCMEVPRAASSLLSTDIVSVLLKLAGSDARQTAVQLNAGIALGKLCTAEPRYSRTRRASSSLEEPHPSLPAPPRAGHWGALRLKPVRGHSMGQGCGRGQGDRAKTFERASGRSWGTWLSRQAQPLIFFVTLQKSLQFPEPRVFQL